jgi:protein TonB
MTEHRASFILASALLAALAAPAGAQTIEKVSLASSAQSYRSDAARHVYKTYASQIYKGMLPPLVHAIVVIETEVDKAGNVRDVRIVRSPSHAPDVTRRVVAMVHKASPFPEPRKLGATRFLETWMVDRGGHFQVHTLTEGQL